MELRLSVENIYFYYPRAGQGSVKKLSLHTPQTRISCPYIIATKC